MLLLLTEATRMRLAVFFPADNWVPRLKSDRDRTRDELAIRYHSLFQMTEIRPESITGFIVSSVVPTLETAWMSYADKYLAVKGYCCAEINNNERWIKTVTGSN